MADIKIDLSSVKDEFVIHYDGRLNEVKANTLANSLIYLANILDEINQEVNPNFKIEIIIEALGSGSFRPKIKLSAHKIKELFGEYVKKDQIIMILIALLSLRQCAGPVNNPKIEIKVEQVIIRDRSKTIVMPRGIYNHTVNIYHNSKIQNNIQNHFNLLEEDTSITDFGLYNKLEDKNPLFEVEKDGFRELGEPTAKVADETHKIEDERIILQVIRSILEKKKRRWEFIYRGLGFLQ